MCPCMSSMIQFIRAEYMFYSVQVVNSAAKTYYMSAGAVSTVQKMVDKVEPSQDKL